MQFKYKTQTLKKFKASLPLLTAFGFIFLTGCSTFRAPSSPPSQIIQSQPLLSNYWSMESKIGIKTEAENGSAQLSWNQMGNRYNISLTGPFGKALGSLQNTGQQILLTSSDGSVQTAKDEEQLVLSAIGKPLPVKQMQFWIKGIKAPFFPIEPVSATVDSVEFIQRDWHVTMSGFHDVDGYRLPKKLLLKYPADSSTSPSGTPVELKIIIKQWDLPAETAYESL